jgi:cytochrome c-type biogenesis protein CcsB
MNKILSIIYSTRLTAVLFLVFATSMAIATFIENDYGTETAMALVYSSWWFEGIMLFFVINFFGNIFKYRLYKKDKWVNLVFHTSFILILIGAGITRYISYEGIMPIREGAVSNTFLTKTNYISIVINDGQEQKTPVHHKILLSSLGTNNYEYNTDFKGTDVSVKLTNYIRQASNVFEENEKGDEYLLFVESSGGSRHDHYIKRGTVQNIHGVLVGFDAPSRSTIDFTMPDGSLKIQAVAAGSFFRMADKFEGVIAKDSLQDFSLLSVHSIAGLQFVIPKPPVKGMYKTVASDQETALSQLEFDVSVADKTEHIKLSGGEFTIQPPTQFKVGNLNFRMSYGARQLELPFSIKLKDFQLEKYPGSESAMSFASEITVIDPEETFDFRIYMNHILNHRGYKFFQSSYRITDEYEETHLSVNFDYWGTLITYIGYFALFGGLLFIFLLKRTRFDTLRKNLKKVKLKKAKMATIGLLLFSSMAFSQHNHELSGTQIDSILDVTKVSVEHAENFSKLIIQDAGGRMKPVHTYASELMRKVSKSENYKDLNAIQVFLSIQQNPRIWGQVPVIYIKKGNTKLRDILGIPHDQKHASFINFFDEKGNYKLDEYRKEAEKHAIKKQFEKDVVNVDRRINLLYSSILGDVLRIFPIQNDENNTWVSHNNLNRANLKGQDSIYVRQLLPIYLQSLSAATRSNDYSSADEILSGIITFQKKYGSAVYPSDHKIDLEISYNKYDIFKKLFSYYMYVGTLLIFLVIFQIFKSNRFVRYLIQTFVAIIVVLFLMHTAGLIARWIVSGHAPWSNAYESMIYVGWATMFFGLIFGRKSSMTLAATAFLTAFILMVAHWNWMDPEIANLVPVLDSYWIMIHVSIIVASYGGFALGMILGLIALILMILTTKKNKKKVWNLIKELTIINEMALTLGLVMLTIGNFLGGMWANESWGRYWGWDPKETWALISIMIYAFVLHLRLIPGMRGQFTFNMFSVAAFASILMTYFGVNFYLSGLHSYASGDKAITPTFVYYAASIFVVISVFAYLKYKKYYKK